MDKFKFTNGLTGNLPSNYAINLEQIFSTKEAVERGLLPYEEPKIILSEIRADLKIDVPSDCVPKNANAYVANIPANSAGFGKVFIPIQFYRK